MKRRSVHRSAASWCLAACGMVLLCLPAAGAASAPAPDSVHFCGVGHGEAWLRDPAPAAGKAASELNAGEPGTVRMIYFLPNNRPFRQSVVDSMKKVIVEAQTFFAEQMDAHGYGPMTFRYEADADGEPVVHRLDGEHDDAHYVSGSRPSPWAQVIRTYEPERHVYFNVIDNSRGLVTRGRNRWYAGFASGLKSRGWVEVSAAFDFILVAHELAHAFGLFWHDFRDDRHVLSYGRNPDRLSSCSAGFLSVTPWFNPDVSHEWDRFWGPAIEFAGASRWYPPGATRVSVPLRVSDPDGVHQVLLYPDEPGGVSRTLELILGACRMLAGQTEAVVTFEYDGVFPRVPNSKLSDRPSHRFWVTAVDRNGNAGHSSLVLAQQSPYHVATLAGGPSTGICLGVGVHSGRGHVGLGVEGQQYGAVVGRGVAAGGRRVGNPITGIVATPWLSSPWRFRPTGGRWRPRRLTRSSCGTWRQGRRSP